MATTKATTARTSRTASVDAKARTKAGAVDVDATVDLTKVRKPFYAYVGAADFAVEKLRHLPEVYIHGLNTAQSQVSDSFKALPTTMREQLTGLPDRAKDAYADFVKRGEKLVKTVRTNPNAQAAIRQAKTARSQAKAATTSVRRAAGSAQKAAESTAAKTG